MIVRCIEARQSTARVDRYGYPVAIMRATDRILVLHKTKARDEAEQNVTKATDEPTPPMAVAARTPADPGAPPLLAAEGSMGAICASRRQVLKAGVASGFALSGGALGVGAGTMGAGPAAADDFDPLDTDPSAGPTLGARRADAAYRVREQAALQHLEKTLELGTQFDNDDEARYAAEHYYASFTKTLPCDARGEVDPAAFEQLQRAMRSGAKADFDAIPSDPFASFKLMNPQGAFKYELGGLDGHATRIDPAHPFRSAALAGEAVEVYWQALTRDVPFQRYQSDPLIAAAVEDLNRLSVPPGVLEQGRVTWRTIFRGETPGDLLGPYLSQFLLMPFDYGPQEVRQRYLVPRGPDYMTDVDTWLLRQRGGAPERMRPLRDRLLIHTSRMLAEYVHLDLTFQAYMNAALILLEYGDGALDRGNPYRVSFNQYGFASLGPPFIVDMVCKAANLGLTGAWFHKWRVNRFLRPEAYGGRVHFHMTGEREYELHSDVLNSQALAEVFSRNGTYLLPQAYPEGSPTHPSFPAGHAAMAGACVTVLKACFDEELVLADPVEADETGMRLRPWFGPSLKAGNELNKLASNIALGRDAAGVHYRQDGIQGLRCGEQQAIALLQDQSRTLNEADFEGFTLTRFDGVRINIRDGAITAA
jgi:membrane-associated phospholipid phosphatase